MVVAQSYLLEVAAFTPLTSSRLYRPKKPLIKRPFRSFKYSLLHYDSFPHGALATICEIVK